MARVLCADDDQLIRRLLVDAFIAGGHEPTAAADGLEAIRLIDDGGPWDLLVTDHSMPGATGIQVIEHAHHVDPSMPSVVVTAYHDLELAMRAMQAGAVGFLPKPFRPAHLLTVASTALERRRLAVESVRFNLVVPMLERFTMLLANTLESKDCATAQHCQRLVSSSESTARRLGLDDNQRLSVRIGACLHDIGKVGIPEQLLRKPGPLSTEEHALVRLHPEIGAAILEDIDTWHDVRMIVRHHHEQWNGSGYPLGLRSVDIPLGARIVSVADAYDVMTSGRPYQAARSHDEAVDELLRQRGRQFDADVVEAFVATCGGPRGYDGAVDTASDLDLIARRATAPAARRSMVGGATR